MLTSIIIGLIFVDLLIFAADRYIWSTTIFLAELAAAWYFIPEVHDFVTIQGYLHFCLTAIPTYLGIGVLVAALKYIAFCHKISRKVEEYTKKFVEAKDINDNRYYQFLSFINVDGGASLGIIRLLKIKSTPYLRISTREEMLEILTPRAGDYIDRIGTWIIQWPLVILSLAFEDVLSKLAEIVASMFGSMFYRLNKYMIGEATKGI